MMRVEHTIKILLSKDNEVVLTKDEAESLYSALGLALNKVNNVSNPLYFAPGQRSFDEINPNRITC
jgi:hypothetical protein